MEQGQSYGHSSNALKTPPVFRKLLKNNKKMIALIDTSKKNSTCQQCKKKISIGELRGVDKFQSFGHTSQKYFCKDCSIEVLGICKGAIEKMLTELK